MTFAVRGWRERDSGRRRRSPRAVVRTRGAATGASYCAKGTRSQLRAGALVPAEPLGATSTLR